MSGPITQPPVTVFCGFLGAGKTTLINHLLTQGAGRRWAVIVNDLAALNIDAALVRTAADGNRKIVDLGNGCVCCSGRDELGEAVAELAASGDYEHILVETTGVAEPRGVAALFTQKNPFGRSLGDFARLSSLVSVIDAVYFLREWREHQQREHREFPVGGQRPVFELMLEQVECADVLLLNKSDLATADELAKLEGIVRGLNPRAECVRCERGEVDSDFLLGRVRFDPHETLRAAAWLRTLNHLAPGAAKTGGNLVVNTRRPPAGSAPRPSVHERAFGIQSMVYQARRPFSEDKLRTFLTEQAPGLLRAKGFFWTSERPDEMGFLSVAGGAARLDYLNYWWASLIESGKASLEERPAAIVALWEEPHGDRRQELVFIGVDLRQQKVEADLAACLA